MAKRKCRARTLWFLRSRRIRATRLEMRTSSEGGFLCFGADQRDEDFVEGGIGLAKTAETDFLGETGLQNGVSIGGFTKFKVPGMGAICARPGFVAVHR